MRAGNGQNEFLDVLPGQRQHMKNNYSTQQESIHAALFHALIQFAAYVSLVLLSES